MQRPHLHDTIFSKRGLRGLDFVDSGGYPADFARIFIGRKFKETKLKGDDYITRDYYGFTYLADEVKDLQKTRFMSTHREKGRRSQVRSSEQLFRRSKGMQKIPEAAASP